MNHQLTKRELIATAAMQAMMSSFNAPDSFDPTIAGTVARAAFKYADAMLEAMEPHSSTRSIEEDVHGE
jgi:hypothetical protein